MAAALPTYRHEAALYQGDAGFLEQTVGFVREGVAAGEPVLVAVLPPKIKLMREALRADAEHVRFVDMAEAGRNPARIIPLWRQFVDSHQGRPVRGIGEPVWAGRSQPELEEALLHEALLNLAFGDDAPLWLRCPYDIEALGPALVDAAHLRHPCVVDSSGTAGPGSHRPPDVVAEFGSALAPVADVTVDVLTFDRMSTVRRIRAIVGQRAVEAGMTSGRASDFALAVHELAANSLRHGGGRGTVRTWSDDVSMVCEVSDAGHITQPLVGRIQPTPTQLSGRGVWLANQLCDLVQIRSSDRGTVIRLHMSL